MQTNHITQLTPLRSEAAVLRDRLLDASREALGARLQIVRIENGLIQADFAKMLGVSRPSYYYYERGKRAISSDQLAILVEKFEVDLQWLITGWSHLFDKLDLNTLEQIELDLDDFQLRSGMQMTATKRRAIISEALRQRCLGDDCNIEFLSKVIQ